MTVDPAAERVGDRYRSVRLRLTPLLASIDAASWDALVPACPGWRVRDVLAHLVGNVEDAMAGRLSGPPPPDQTREQVDRHRLDDPRALLDQWTELAPGFEDAVSSLGVWPAFIDVLSHEHDIRAALGDRRGRDDGDVVFAAGLLAQGVPPGMELTIDGRICSVAGADPTARLAVTSFDLLRIRLGRRSRSQVRAMGWDGDPGPQLDALFVFGPTPTDQPE